MWKWRKRSSGNKNPEWRQTVGVTGLVWEAGAVTVDHVGLFSAQHQREKAKIETNTVCMAPFMSEIYLSGTQAHHGYSNCPWG